VKGSFLRFCTQDAPGRRKLKFYRAIMVFLLAGAFLMPAVAVAGTMSNDFNRLPPHSDESPLLYASPQTRALFGDAAEGLALAAGMDLLLVTRSDLVRFMPPGGRGAAAAGQAFDRFAESVGGFSFDRLRRDALRAPLIRAAYYGAPHGFPMPAAYANEAPVCAVVLPELKDTGRAALIEQIAGSAARYAENLPASDDLWRYFVAAHEIAHCRHSYNEYNPVTALGYEIEADQAGFDALEKLPGGAEVARAVLGLRAVSSLLHSQIHHATSAALVLPGAVNKMTGEAWHPARLATAQAKAREAIRYYALHGQPPVADAGPGRARYVPPRRFYRAALALHTQGYFVDDPLQQRYVGLFLEAAQQYFPTYFVR